MTDQWYVQESGIECGPYSFSRLSEMIRHGRVTGRHLIRADDTEEWRPVDSESCLVPLLRNKNCQPGTSSSLVSPTAARAQDLLTATICQPTPGNSLDTSNPDSNRKDVIGARHRPATDDEYRAEEPNDTDSPLSNSKPKSSPEFRAAVREAMQKLQSPEQESPAEQKVGLTVFLGRAIREIVLLTFAVALLPVRIVGSLVAYIAGFLFTRPNQVQNRENIVIKLLDRLNGYSQSHFSDSTLRYILRFGAPFVGMNVTAYWLMNWTQLESMRFPSRKPEASQLTLPLIGDCSEFEYWFFFGNFVLFIGIAFFCSARWLEARTDD